MGFYAGSGISQPKSVRAKAKPTLHFARSLRMSRPKVVYISWQLLRVLTKRDSVKSVAKIMPKEHGWVDTRLGALVDEANAINMAARFGRARCVRFLLNSMGAKADIPDANGMSPVGAAAWGGYEQILRDILECGQLIDIHRLGTPFKTSSCGGKGPFTPIEWARRKGHKKIVRMLEEYLLVLKENEDAEGGEEEGGKGEVVI
ncbi:hypothetical protein TrRE_jg13478 [Triparma retinervis]|uniref:Ankyrin n=1 Tax=Triparma retinervis TaxID=2557542 RepID=A0A9W7A6V8_9STRA|nr:hypothetical protein TrRE_jg13478 [Triparma retinervis]